MTPENREAAEYAAATPELLAIAHPTEATIEARAVINAEALICMLRSCPSMLDAKFKVVVELEFANGARFSATDNSPTALFDILRAIVARDRVTP